LRRRVDEVDRLDVAAVYRLLQERPICRGGKDDPGFTLYAVVMELAPVPTLHLTAGPPGEDRKLQTFTFKA